jgi:magnesium transporter
MDRLVDAYMPLIDRFDEQIEGIETKILSASAGKTVLRSEREIIPRILRVKRSLQLLRRTTIYQREILLRLARAEFDEIPRELVPFYRDVYDHFARVTELVDSYRELVTNLLEAHLSLQSNRMNEVMKRLTIISTVMLPLSLVAGIYGMNFKVMPELEWAYGYPTALGLMALVAAGILTWFKAKKWL